MAAVQCLNCRVTLLYHGTDAQSGASSHRDLPSCTVEFRPQGTSAVPDAPGQASGSGTNVDSSSGTTPAAFRITDAPGHSLSLTIARGTNPSFPQDGTIVATLGEVGALCTMILQSEVTTAFLRVKEALQAAAAAAAANDFDTKTDASSAHMYFHYYGMLQHQQNMMQDGTRTGTYFWAMMNNTEDFKDKAVADVGAGSGILSLFAAQAGARKVYALEASNVVRFARKLFAANGAFGQRIEVLHGKVETMALPERVDVLVSEPMGTLLVNERMLETYIWARKHMLKPGGKMFPSLGRIFCAGFSDAMLFSELASMAQFWASTSFFGVDLSALHGDAIAGYYNKVVVDSFDPGILSTTMATHTIDFMTADETDLFDIVVPLRLAARGNAGFVHGIACWFDVLFPGTNTPMWLSTAPGSAATHWFQLRCVLQEPIQIVEDGQILTGELRLKAHANQSYDVHVTLESRPVTSAADAVSAPMSTDATSPMQRAPQLQPQRAHGVFDLKDPYYRQLRTASAWPTEAS